MFSLTQKSRAPQSSVLLLVTWRCSNRNWSQWLSTVWNLWDLILPTAFLNLDPGSRSDALGLPLFSTLISTSVIQIMDKCFLFYLLGKKKLPLTSEEAWNDDHCAGCFNLSSSFRGLKQVQNKQFIAFSRHGRRCDANWVIGWTSDLSFN